MVFVKLAAPFALIIGALAGCTPSTPYSRSQAKLECTDSFTGSRLCDSNGAPESSDGLRDPSVGTNMPTHPGGP